MSGKGGTVMVHFIVDEPGVTLRNIICHEFELLPAENCCYSELPYNTIQADNATELLTRLGKQVDPNNMNIVSHLDMVGAIPGNINTLAIYSPSGTFEVDVDLKISGAFMKLLLQEDHTIEINDPDVTLELEGLDVSTCGCYWDGIIVNDGRLDIYDFTTLSQAKITKAKRGVVVRNGGVASIRDAEFYFNQQNIRVENTTNTHPFHIADARPNAGPLYIEGTAIARFPFWWTDDEYPCGWGNWGSVAGVSIEDADMVTVGVMYHNRNEFYDLFQGVRNTSSDLEVVNTTLGRAGGIARPTNSINQNTIGFGVAVDYDAGGAFNLDLNAPAPNNVKVIDAKWNGLNVSYTDWGTDLDLSVENCLFQDIERTGIAVGGNPAPPGGSPFQINLIGMNAENNEFIDCLHGISVNNLHDLFLEGLPRTINIENNSFEKPGGGIQGTAISIFEMNYEDLHIRENEIAGGATGIRLRNIRTWANEGNGQVIVDHNILWNLVETGVHVQTTPPLGSNGSIIEIYRNTVNNPPGAVTRTGILCETSTGFDASDLIIDIGDGTVWNQNIIAHTNIGVMVRGNGQTTRVLNNNISFLEDMGESELEERGLSAGVSILNCDDPVVVSGNTVVSSFSNTAWQSGVYVRGSRNNLICNNTFNLDGLHGVIGDGPNMSTRLQRNDIRNFFTGVNLQREGAFGDQYGLRISNPGGLDNVASWDNEFRFGTVDLFTNASDGRQTPFGVRAVAPFLPAVTENFENGCGNPGEPCPMPVLEAGQDVTVTHHLSDCETVTPLNPGEEDDGGDDWPGGLVLSGGWPVLRNDLIAYDAIAANAAVSPEWNDGLNAQDRFDLYGLLADYPALRTASAALDSFYLARQGTNIADLHEARGLMAQAQEVELIVATGDTAAGEPLIYAQDTAATAARDALLAGAQTLLAGITPAHDVEANYKTVYDVRATQMRGFTDTLTAAQVAALTPVAEACPLSDGKAVYDARAFVLEVLPPNTLQYDSCLTLEEPDTTQLRLTAEAPPAAPRAELYPNPAADAVTLSLTGELASAVLLEAYNAVGGRMLARELPAGTRRASFDVSGWPEGVYLVKTRSADGQLNAAQKLVVTE